MIGQAFVVRFDVRIVRSIAWSLAHHGCSPSYCDATEGRAWQFLLSWSSRAPPRTERTLACRIGPKSDQGRHDSENVWVCIWRKMDVYRYLFRLVDASKRNACDFVFYSRGSASRDLKKKGDMRHRSPPRDAHAGRSGCWRNWHFTTPNARIKLKHLYPSICESGGQSVALINSSIRGFQNGLQGIRQL
jgi:hypothetical protein